MGKRPPSLEPDLRLQRHPLPTQERRRRNRSGSRREEAAARGRKRGLAVRREAGKEAETLAKGGGGEECHLRPRQVPLHLLPIRRGSQFLVHGGRQGDRRGHPG